MHYKLQVWCILTFLCVVGRFWTVVERCDEKRGAPHLTCDMTLKSG